MKLWKNKAVYHPLTATPFKRNPAYTELAPSSELSSYVRCYWGTAASLVQEADDNAPQIVIPDTCVDIIYYIDHTDHTVSGGFCGINDRSFIVPGSTHAGHAVETFAIRFYAWSAYAFAEDSLKATMNGYFEAAFLFAWLDRMLRPSLLEWKTLQERAFLVERLLRKNLSGVRGNKIVDDTIQNILSNRGSLEVSDLAKGAFVSTRQLERLFHEYIGITPKKLSNLVRYQFLWRDILLEKDFDVLSAVHKYGYSDQSHLLREFKRYHSMDIQEARNLAFHDVVNIQDVSDG